MTRSSTRPPGSTLTTSGSPSVRSLVRNASYVTSFKSGLPASIVMPGAIVPIPFRPVEAGAGGDEPAMDDMLLPFLSSAKMCSGGVKLKSASVTTTSCWSGRSG